jgi:hypothetical protein
VFLGRIETGTPEYHAVLSGTLPTREVVETRRTVLVVGLKSNRRYRLVRTLLGSISQRQHSITRCQVPTVFSHVAEHPGMELSAFREPLSREETAGLLAAAAVVAVVLGPDAITLAEGSSVLLTAVSALAMGTLAFVVGALALVAIRELRGDEGAE